MGNYVVLIIVFFACPSCAIHRLRPYSHISLSVGDSLVSALENTTLLYKIEDLDRVSKHMLNRQYQPFHIANPGEPYNPGCTKINKVPSKRLVVAGRSARLSFVLFEEGGAGIQTQCCIILKEPQTAHLYQLALPPVSDFAGLLRVIKNNEQTIFSCYEMDTH